MPAEVDECFDSPVLHEGLHWGCHGMHVLNAYGAGDIQCLLHINLTSRLGPRSSRMRLAQSKALPWAAPQVWHDLKQPSKICCAQQAAVPGGCRCELASHDLSDAVGMVKSEEERGQLVLQLIAAYAVADYPLTLYLSDGLIYHRVILNGKHLAYWQDLKPREALYYMVTDLKKVGARPFPAAHDACHVAQSKMQQVCIGQVCVLPMMRLFACRPPIQRSTRWTTCRLSRRRSWTSITACQVTMPLLSSWTLCYHTLTNQLRRLPQPCS